MLIKKERRKKNKQKKAFTLIEMLISISLFTIVVTIAFTALYSIMDANAKAKTIKLVVNNLNMAMESMTREIRVGYNYTCRTAVGDPLVGGQDCSGTGGNVLALSTKDNEIVIYSFNSGAGTIQRKKGTEVVNLVGDDIVIEDLRFFVNGTGTANNIQPRVLVILKGTINNIDIATEFDIQTTVSQRKIDK